jgi:hypothetical protein
MASAHRRLLGRPVDPGVVAVLRELHRSRAADVNLRGGATTGVGRHLADLVIAFRERFVLTEAEVGAIERDVAAKFRVLVEHGDRSERVANLTEMLRRDPLIAVRGTLRSLRRRVPVIGR